MGGKRLVGWLANTNAQVRMEVDWPIPSAVPGQMNHGGNGGEEGAWVGGHEMPFLLPCLNHEKRLLRRSLALALGGGRSWWFWVGILMNGQIA